MGVFAVSWHSTAQREPWYPAGVSLLFGKTFIVWTNSHTDENEWKTHLFSLHHLLIEVVGESALWVELSGSLGAHEHTVLTHQTSSADGDQRDAVAAHPLVQVEVSALHLRAHRDRPAQTEELLTPVFLCLWVTSSCCKCKCEPCCVWIPDHHVSVGPGDDAALAWVQVVDLCSVRARHCHKTILVHLSCNLQVSMHQKYCEETHC